MPFGPGVDGFFEAAASALAPLGVGVEGPAEGIPASSLGPGIDGTLDLPSCVTSTPFRYVRSAIPVQRNSTPFRFPRDAARVTRIGTPFIYVRNIGLPPQGYGSPTTGLVAPAEPIQTFGSPTKGLYLAPPAFSFGGSTSGVVEFTSLAPINNLVAIGVAPGKISLTWGVLTSGDPTSFRIERSLNGQGNFSEIGTVSGTTFIFVDVNATPLIVFDYRVFSLNMFGESTSSNIATASSPPPPPGISPPPSPKPPSVLEFLSPGSSGLERDLDGNTGGTKF